MNRDCTNNAYFGHESDYLIRKSVNNRFVGAKAQLVRPMILSLLFNISTSPQIRSIQIFCNIMFWIVASELINLDIKYPYIYCFGR